MTLIEQIEAKAVKYKPYRNLNEAIIETCNLIQEKQKNNPKMVYDVLGRVWIYNKPEDLKNIKLEPEVEELTRKIAKALL